MKLVDKPANYTPNVCIGLKFTGHNKEKTSFELLTYKYKKGKNTDL
ncbi:MAG: hypothetical protein ABSE89_00210 [Sedimentisphaerales bacterium]